MRRAEHDLVAHEDAGAIVGAVAVEDLHGLGKIRRRSVLHLGRDRVLSGLGVFDFAGRRARDDRQKKEERNEPGHAGDGSKMYAEVRPGESP